MSHSALHTSAGTPCSTPYPGVGSRVLRGHLHTPAGLSSVEFRGIMAALILKYGITNYCLGRGDLSGCLSGRRVRVFSKCNKLLV